MCSLHLVVMRCPRGAIHHNQAMRTQCKSSPWQVGQDGDGPSRYAYTSSSQGLSSICSSAWAMHDRTQTDMRDQQNQREQTGAGVSYIMSASPSCNEVPQRGNPSHLGNAYSMQVVPVGGGWQVGQDSGGPSTHAYTCMSRNSHAYAAMHGSCTVEPQTDMREV